MASPDPDVNPDSNSNPRPKSNSDPGSSPYSRHLPGPKSHQSNTWSNPELVQNIKTEEKIKKEEALTMPPNKGFLIKNGNLGN